MCFRRSFTQLIYLAIEKQKNKHHDCPWQWIWRKEDEGEARGKRQSGGAEKTKSEAPEAKNWGWGWVSRRSVLESGPSPQSPGSQTKIGNFYRSFISPSSVLMEGPCLLVIFRCECPSGAMWRHWPATIEQRQPREWAELDNGHFWGQMEKLGEALVINTESLSAGAGDFSGWKRTG